MKSLFVQAHLALMSQSIDEKIKLTQELSQDWLAGLLNLKSHSHGLMNKKCGLPKQLELVPLSKLPSRNINSPKGHAALLHSIAHIEFSAINLALDAVWRFQNMPKEYYTDWVRVAYEEQMHFGLIQTRLQNLGYVYGDFPVHNGLWKMAKETAEDVLVRMALVPRVLEARGLDVTPLIIKKLQQLKDTESIAILDIIFKDEITHVAIGTKWFRFLCQQKNINSEQMFEDIIQDKFNGKLRGPFANEARAKAGFSQRELNYLGRL